MSEEVAIDTPPRCDVHPDHSYAAVDGSMGSAGPWAYLCSACWTLYGVGSFGTGRGQRLVMKVIPPRHREMFEAALRGEPVNEGGVYRCTPDDIAAWELHGTFPVPPFPAEVLPPIRLGEELIFFYEVA